jgi:hypothetical protein
MLSPNALANFIYSEVRGSITKDNIMQTLPTVGHAIAKYLCKNTDIVYSWSGTIPGSPPTPDPVVTYTTKNVAGDIILTPTGVLDPVMNGYPRQTNYDRDKDVHYNRRARLGGNAGKIPGFA